MSRSFVKLYVHVIKIHFPVTDAHEVTHAPIFGYWLNFCDKVDGTTSSDGASHFC